jgi:hypothetical protein
MKWTSDGVRFAQATSLFHLKSIDSGCCGPFERRNGPLSIMQFTDRNWDNVGEMLHKHMTD